MILSLTWLTNCSQPASDENGETGSPGLTREYLAGEWIRKGPGPPTSLHFKENGTVEGDLMMDGRVEVMAGFSLKGKQVEILDSEGQTCPGKGIYEVTPGRNYIGFEMVEDTCYGRIRAIMGYWTKPGYEDILIDLDQEIQKNNDPELLLERARVLMAIGKTAEAKASFDAYIKIDSTNAKSYMNRAGTRFPNDLQGVISDCTKAIALDPDDKNAYHMRGIARYQLGRTAEACEDFSSAIQLGYTFLEKTEAAKCAGYWEGKKE